MQVRVPQAELQELLPAGRLLSSATRVSPEQYERAKGAFLQQVSHAGLAAQVPHMLRSLKVNTCGRQHEAACPIPSVTLLAVSQAQKGRLLQLGFIAREWAPRLRCSSQLLGVKAAVWMSCRSATASQGGCRRSGLVVGAVQDLTELWRWDSDRWLQLAETPGLEPAYRECCSAQRHSSDTESVMWMLWGDFFCHRPTTGTSSSKHVC